jgi:hypothetical protein
MNKYVSFDIVIHKCNEIDAMNIEKNFGWIQKSMLKLVRWSHPEKMITNVQGRKSPLKGERGRSIVECEN